MLCCSPPKWGPWGTAGPKKLAKLMVIGGLTECVRPRGRESVGLGVSSELTCEMGQQKLCWRTDTEAPGHPTGQQGCPGDRDPAVRGQPLEESRASQQCFQALACPADAG